MRVLGQSVRGRYRGLVKEDEPITMEIPIRFTGEEKAPGAKAGAIFIHSTTTLNIKCLPADLPQHIDVDVSEMTADKIIHLSDIKCPNNVEVLHMTDETPIVSMQMPRAKSAETQPEENTDTEDTEDK